MEVERISVAKEEAEKQYKSYLKAIKIRKEKYLEDLKKLYGHLRHGRAVIDLYVSLEKAGLDEDSNPRLAIVRADSTKVRFEKRWNNSGVFYRYDAEKRNWAKDIEIPSGIFQWERIRKEYGNGYVSNTIKNAEIETIAPIIPAEILNTIPYNLKNYHILWEVEQWKRSPPKDPILLKKITPNLFVVLATWNLTPLERAVIRGRIS